MRTCFSFSLGFNTWSKRLQEPGAPRPARCAGCRLGGVKASYGLDVGPVVSCGGDLQHGDDGALIQQAIRGHDFSEALFTAADAGLREKVGLIRGELGEKASVLQPLSHHHDSQMSKATIIF